MRKLLVMDGSVGVRDRVCLVLGHDYTLLLAGSRREALAYACMETIDLALVGVSDPVEDALDLIQALIEIRPALRLLLLVDRHLQQAVAPLLSKGISETLPRTFDPQALVAKVKTILPEPSTELPGPEISNLKSQIPDEETKAPFEERCPPLRPLAAEMAHRLRNPLVSIATFTRLLKDRFDDPSFRRDFYNLVGQEIERLDGTIDLLTALAALPVPEPRACDLKLLVEEASAAEADALGRKALRVRTPMMRGMPAVTVDPFYARYVTTLALRTAIQESPQGAELIWSAAMGARSGPEGSPMIELQLLFPGPPLNPHIRGLEVVLAEFALTSFSGRVEVEARPDGRKAIRLAFLASSSAVGVPESEVLANLLLGRQAELVFQNSVDRRTRTEAIAFIDRRTEERRRSPSAILAKDRRRILGTFEEVVP